MTGNVVDDRETPRVAVDLSFDGGEGFDDEALLEFVASVNIACGGHAGDERSMRTVTRLALRRSVAINAHPSYAGPGFGRKSLQIPPAELEASVAAQIETLRNVVRQEKGELVGVKPHGALYHDAAREPAIAEALARAAHAVSPGLVLVTSPGSALFAAGAALGMAVAAEGFADRGYGPDGSLVPRGEPGALLDPEAAVAQSLGMVLEHRVRTTDGTLRALAVDSLGFHGDTPGALAIARAVRAALLSAGVDVRPLKGRRPAGPDPGPPGGASR